MENNHEEKNHEVNHEHKQNHNHDSKKEHVHNSNNHNQENKPKPVSHGIADDHEAFQSSAEHSRRCFIQTFPNLHIKALHERGILLLIK